MESLAHNGRVSRSRFHLPSASPAKFLYYDDIFWCVKIKDIHDICLNNLAAILEFMVPK